MAKFVVLTAASAVLNVAFVKQWPLAGLLSGCLFAIGLYMGNNHG